MTQKELEDMGQMRISYRNFTDDEARKAISYYSQLILKAETFTDNPKACQQPGRYRDGIMDRILKDDRMIEGVVALWRQAAKDGTLGEPLWPGQLKREPISLTAKVA